MFTDLEVDLEEFNPTLTLVPGQSFNWRKLGDDNYWVGMADATPLIFEQHGTGSRVASLDVSVSGSSLLSLVQSYLQLDVHLKDLYGVVSF